MVGNMDATDDPLNGITGQIIDAAIAIHRGLGPGLFESVYETILARDLQRRGLRVLRQSTISFDYDGLHFADAGRIDILVENQIVVELKSIEQLAPVHAKQVLTYLRLLKLPLGLLINFGTPVLKNGIRRIANGSAGASYPDANSPRAIRSI